jgi:hypothetical protein
VDQPILFTSNSATVTAGQWGRVEIHPQAVPGTRIENAVLEGAGYYSDGGVVVHGGSPALKSVTFRKNRGSGVRVDGGSPTIAGNVITAGTERGLWLLSNSTPRVLVNSIIGNAGVGIQNEGSRAAIRFNTVSGNGGDGLLSVNGTLGIRDNAVTGNGAPARNNDGSSKTLDLRQQWWGAETPPAGLAGRVEYDPWLGSAPTPLFAVSSFERSTAAFNPDGAGVRFSFGFPSPASWTLTLTNSGGAEVRTYSGSGASGSVLWDGHDSAAGGLADGTYSYRLSGTESVASTSAAPLSGRIALDRTIPLALLTAPLAGQTVVSPLEVTGTAAGSGFADYKLEYGTGEYPSTMTAIDRGSVAMAAGPLGLWSAALSDPVYTLRLTVTAAGGKSATQTLTVRLSGQTACE